MVNISNLTTNPQNFINGNAKKITCYWDAIIDPGDNDVDIYLAIEQNCPVYFIDASNGQQKEVHLGTFTFTEQEKNYAAATFIIVTEPRDEALRAIVTMTAIDARGKKSKTNCTIMYQ